MTELADLALRSPVAVRVAVGMMGIVVLLAGARLYKPTMFTVAFAFGSLLTLFLMSGGAIEKITAVHLSAGLVGGLVGLGLCALVHALGLALLGGWGGATLAVAVIDVFPEIGVWWAPIVGAVLGAVFTSLLFKTMLKVVTPAIGAGLITWAIGFAANPWLLIGLWVFGTWCQFSMGRRSTERVKGAPQ
jgi:hypothetical protein